MFFSKCARYLGMFWLKVSDVEEAKSKDKEEGITDKKGHR